MPRHQPKPTYVRFRPNAAAAALGVGINPEQWTPEGIIAALSTRYTQLVKLAEEEKQKHETRKPRLYMAGAFELATVIASYYQGQGATEDYLRWDRRARQASTLAYRRDNPVLPTLGADEQEPDMETVNGDGVR